MSEITLLSLNVRGMRNGMKRRKIFRYLKMNKANICMLQETHSSIKDCNLWSSEWGNKCIYSHGETNARGVAILLDKALTIQEIRRDMDGRRLILKVEINNYSYCIANIYGNNEDKPEFLQKSNRKSMTLTVSLL